MAPGPIKSQVEVLLQFTPPLLLAYQYHQWSVVVEFEILQVLGILLLLVVMVALPRLTVVESRRGKVEEYFQYGAMNCRAYSASLTEFGGVGDGTTLNTKAFQAAIDHLSQFASYGGSQLYVPPGRWLTGSFNITSHFTLFLHKDAVLLASQVSYFTFICLSGYVI